MNIQLRIQRVARALQARADIFKEYPAGKLRPAPKDRKRIHDMIMKPWDKGLRGDAHKSAVQDLARRMAKSIKSADKAWRRGEAAESENYHDVAKIFFDRASELLS